MTIENRNNTRKPMNIESELYVLTGDTAQPLKIRNRLMAAKAIARDVLGTEDNETVLAVFDQLRSAAELAPWDGDGVSELH